MGHFIHEPAGPAVILGILCGTSDKVVVSSGQSVDVFRKSIQVSLQTNVYRLSPFRQPLKVQLKGLVNGKVVGECAVLLAVNGKSCIAGLMCHVIDAE